MKTLEKLVRTEILRLGHDGSDPLQFAYRLHRDVEDATLSLRNMRFKHLDGKGIHALLLFVDFF